MLTFKNKKKLLLVGLVSLPVVFLATLLIFKEVNVPFWDQWELVPIIQDYNNGHLTLHDLWQQHNEHRIFFPRIVMMIFAAATHWNTAVEAYVGFLIAVIGFIVLCLTFRNSQKKITSASIALLTMFSVIWFSTVQYENWMWGWQIQWFLSTLGVILAAFAISRIKKSKLTNSNLILLITAIILAQYSLANGSILWPIIIVMLWLLKVEAKKIAVMITTGLLTTGLYFYHYTSPANPPSSVAADTIGFIKYVLIYVGRPLSFLHKLTPLIGLIILISFCAITIYLFIKRRQRFYESAPWIVLGSYALGSALITGYGRLGFGVSEAYVGRYTTVSDFLLISTIMLAWTNRDILLKKRFLKDRSGLIITVTTATISILIATNFVWGLHNVNVKSQYLTDIRRCTHEPKPSDVCYLSAYPKESTVQKRLEYLKKIHWGGY